MNGPTTVLGAEDSYRTQERPRRAGLYLARPPALEPFRRQDPAEDVWFVPRDPGSVTAPARGIVRPAGCENLDAGVTIALVVGDDGVSVGAVAVALDVVRRDVPNAQASLARSFPTHTPVGLRVPRDALGGLGDLGDLRLTLTVDGEVRQDARTSDMVVSPEELLTSVTRRVRLRPGDLVLTGTPPGLAVDRGDGWLVPGNHLVATVEGIGTLETKIVTELEHPIETAVAARSSAFDPRRVFVTGTNYRSHVAEMGTTAPPVPTANLVKIPTAWCGTGDDIMLPPGACVDYEGEIAVVIGADARDVAPADADAVIAGLCLANDVSARDAPTPHLVLAKNAPGFGPLGPALVPTATIDLDMVTFTVSVNGEVRQCGDTRDMIFSIREIVASYSAAIALHAGDVILTGSPAGVGVALDPPVFLEPGDTVVVESPELGKLSNRFVASPRLPDEHADGTEPS